MNFYRVFSFTIFLQFPTSADAEAAIPTASCDGTSVKSFAKRAAQTKLCLGGMCRVPLK